MKEQLKAFENKPAEIVFNWHDSETEAKGWVVINSLRGGAAGGGTRMRKGLTEHEVLSLAKTMEIKFSVAGPAIGGAKSGIDFDPNDPRKDGVLNRWYKAVRPLLKHYYGTGGDLNVDQKTEVIPITSALGILHPQEGVLQGHFNPNVDVKKQKIANLQQGVSWPVTSPFLTPDVDRDYKVGDMITGWGTAESVRHYYNLHGQSLEGKRVIIQGWGNVASAAAYYLAQSGAVIVGIIDRVGGLMNPDGYSFEEIKALFNNKSGNFLVAEDMLSFDEVDGNIWSMGAEIFIPAAASRLINRIQLHTMLTHGLEVIRLVPMCRLQMTKFFMDQLPKRLMPNVLSYPDFISNCGMARAFGYLMSDEAQLMTKPFSKTPVISFMTPWKTFTNAIPVQPKLLKQHTKLRLRS